MSKTVNKVCLASLLLLLCAMGSCNIGQRQREQEFQRINAEMEATGLNILHVTPNTNSWEITGFLLYLASMSVGFAALMLWRQDEKERG